MWDPLPRCDVAAKGSQNLRNTSGLPGTSPETWRGGGIWGSGLPPLGCWSWVSDEVSGELSSKRSSMENHVSVALCSFLHMA